ncbi:MAG: S1C family serine protease [Chloroflexota bacterium]
MLLGPGVVALLLLGGLAAPPVAGAPLADHPTPSSVAAAPDPGVLARVRPAVVRIVARTQSADEPGVRTRLVSSGSGLIITTGGLVVTNHHVVAGAEGPVQVYLEGRDDPASGDVIGASECSDLAVIRVPARNLPKPLDWASEPVTEGDGILALGYPEGERRLVVTEGVVVAEARHGPSRFADVGLEIRHSAATKHGDSGGPLLDAATGQVVGVGYAGNDDAGASWAIAAPEAAAAAALISVRQGPMSGGILGMAIPPNGAEPGRVLVNAVDVGSLADKAGIMAGDVIARIDGTPPADDETMSAWCDRLRGGIHDPVSVEVDRGGALLRGDLGGSPLVAGPGVVVHGWSPAEQVASGRAFDPYLLQGRDGEDVIVWSAGSEDGLPGIRVSRRTERGGWVSQRVSKGPDVSPWAALDSRGRLVVVFTRQTGPRRGAASKGIYMATERGDGWKVVRVSNGRDTAPVVRVYGSRMHISFVRHGGGVVYMTRTGSRPWSTRTFRGSPDNVAMRLGTNGAVHLAWTRGKTLTYATNRSGRWLGDIWNLKRTLGAPAMTLAASGTPVLAMRYGRDTVVARIRVRGSTPSTLSWTPVFRSGERSSPKFFGEPRIVNVSGGQAVTWAGVGSGEQGVWVAQSHDGDWMLEHVTHGSLDASPTIMSEADGFSLAYSKGDDGLWFAQWRP